MMGEKLDKIIEPHPFGKSGRIFEVGGDLCNRLSVSYLVTQSQGKGF